MSLRRIILIVLLGSCHSSCGQNGAEQFANSMNPDAQVTCTVDLQTDTHHDIARCWIRRDGQHDNVEWRCECFDASCSCQQLGPVMVFVQSTGSGSDQ